MTEAPQSPTTDELKAEYGISLQTELAVLEESEAVSARLKNNDGLVAIVGGCAMTSDRIASQHEGRRIAEFRDELIEDRPVVLHRIPPWKPRTKPESWHGEETTNPVGAYRTLASLATDSANVAIELASRAHVDRYGSMVSFGWIGSRNVEDMRLGETVAVRDPKMSIGVKNGVGGDIEQALDVVERINYLRRHVENPAPAVLIYRGGENADTPELWELAYRRALEATEGKLIVDVAHGSEMAHDPNGGFNKSIVGQILAMEAVIRIADLGEVPAGIMIEASDIVDKDPDHRTDPNMPLTIALQGISQLNGRKCGYAQGDYELLPEEDQAERIARIAGSVRTAETAASLTLHPGNALY